MGQFDRFVRLPRLLAGLLVTPIVCCAGGIEPVPLGNTIAVRPCTNTEHPPKTNAIPFQESFESYPNNSLIHGTNGWYSTPDDMTHATNAVLPGKVTDFPIVTNHTRYARLQTYGEHLVNVITGNQEHVWLDMLVAFVPVEENPPTNGIAPQLLLYANYRSNLCVYARPPNTNKAIYVESSCQMNAPFSGPPTFYRLSVHIAYLAPPTGGCFAVYLNDAAVDWPGGESLPGVPTTDGQGPWLRCAPGASNSFPGIAFRGTGYLDDLVVTDHYVLRGSDFIANIEGAATIAWPSEFGRRYQVDACTNLLFRDWQPQGETVKGNGITNLFNDTTNGLPLRFYRVRTVDP